MSEDEVDRDLVKAAQDRKEHAPAFLVSRYGPRLLGYCQDIAPDLGDADREHIVADAIEKAVAKIDKFDPAKAKFGIWVRGFVLNRVRDWRRDNERLLSFDDEERSITEPATDALGTLLTHKRTASEAHAVSDRNQPLLDAVLEALPKLRPDDQLIIALRDLEGRNVESVAASLKIGRDACRQRHSRARKRLKDKLLVDPRSAALLSGDNE
jgi:RNA polymerase sigma factor (sigma-70 family)